MSEFVDINEVSKKGGLPSEALKLGESYIEEVIEGYRTLYVKGREETSVEIETVDLIGVDGKEYLDSKVESREIKVGFNIWSNDSKDLRLKFRKLNAIMLGGDKEKRLIFNDELDYFYKGHFSSIDGIEEGRLEVKGEIVFECLDPLAYSIRLKKGNKISTDSLGLKVEKIKVKQKGLTSSENTERNYNISDGIKTQNLKLDYKLSKENIEFPDGIVDNLEVELKDKEINIVTKITSEAGDKDLDMVENQTVGNKYDSLKYYENPNPYVSILEIEAVGEGTDEIEIWAREVRL